MNKLWPYKINSPLRSLTVTLVLFLFALLQAGFPLSAEAGWTNLGLDGGQVYEIAIDSTLPNKMFAGTYYGDGLYVTTNGGTTWTPVLTGHEGGELDGEATFRNTAVFAVKLAPSNHNIIWVAHNYCLEKSTNGGATWTHISNDTIQQNCTNCGGVDDDFRYCESLAIDPTDPNIVYVGTGGPDGSDSKGAIYKTTNGGGSWTKLGMIDPFTAGGYNVTLDHEFYATVGDIAIHPSDSNILWALDFNDVLGDYRGFLYLSIDGGQTWDWDVGVPSNIAEQGLVVKPDEPNVVFIGCFGRNDAVEQFGGVFRVEYPKDGETVLWEIKPSWSSPLPAGANNVRALAFDPQNDSILYAASGLTGGFKLLKSLDGGDTFKEYVHDRQFISLTPHPTNSDIIFGGDRTMGVYKGELINDKTDYDWTPSIDGIHAIRVNDLAVDPNKSDHLLAATMGGVFEKQGAGAWTPTDRLPYDEAFSVAFDPSDTTGSTYYAGIESYLAKTTNNGTSWTRSNNLGYPHFVNSIAVNPNDTTNLYVTTRYPGGVYKSNDSGSTLTSVMKFSAVLDSDVSNGTLTLNDEGSFTYDHDNSDTTTDTFTYHINDGVTNSGTATVTINITGTATSPLAVNDTYTVEKGGSLTRTIPPGVLNNDVGSNLEAVLDSDVFHGTLSLYKDGSFSYIHDNSDTTADTFTYHVIEGEVESNIATVTIHIAPTINPPVAINDSYTVEKGGDLTVTHSWKWFPIGVLHNDVQTNNFDFNTVAIDPDPQTPDHVFVGGGNYFGAKVLGKIYETTNGGNTWSVALDDVIVNSLLIDPNDTNKIYAGCGWSGGTEVPLYKSIDGGTNWTKAFAGIPGSPSRYGIWGSAVYDIFVLRHTGSIPKGGFDDDWIPHYGSSGWSKMEIGVSTPLYDIWGISGSDVFAVGKSGTIVHYNGTNWNEQTSGVTEDLYGVWSNASNNVFAVGDSGKIVYYNGSSWATMSSITTRDLRAVWGETSGSNVFVVGSYGVILKYNTATGLTQMTSNSTARLEDVWGSAGNDIFTVGSATTVGASRYYTVLHYNGSGWSRMTTPTVPAGKSGKLLSIWGSGPSDVWAVGEDGITLHYNGSNWSSIASGVTEHLYGVWASASNNAYAVGRFGAIIRYNGSIWSPVTIAGSGAGYIAGENISIWNPVTDLAFSTEGKLFASTNRQGIYASSNEARNWVNMSAPPYATHAVSAGSVIVGGDAGAYSMDGEGILYGSVSASATGLPLQDVKVKSALGKFFNTNFQGEWSMHHPAGEFDLTASIPGYRLETEWAVPVFDATFTYVTFGLEDNIVPVAVPDVYNTPEETALIVPAPGVLGNDTDGDRDSLTAVLDTGPSHSSAFVLNSNGSFSYTPTADFIGTDSITYHASDGTADSNTTTITITVEEPDTDNDGMPDAWEVMYGLNPLVNDAAGDLDNDGFSNLIEYQKGTLPNDKFSHPSRAMSWLLLLLGDE